MISAPEKFGGKALVNCALNPIPDPLSSGEVRLHLRLSGFVRVWNMDHPDIAKRKSGAKGEVTRCDFAALQGVNCVDRNSHLVLMEFKPSLGKHSKVRKQLREGKEVLQKMAGDKIFSRIDVLTPIWVYTAPLSRRDIGAIDPNRAEKSVNRHKLRHNGSPVDIKLLKSGEAIDDQFVAKIRP